MSEEFYVSLPSNSNPVEYPNNTITNFTVKLDAPLRFEGNWVVGLVEAQYPLTWNNVVKCMLLIRRKTSGMENRAFLHDGQYRTPEALVEALHNLLSSYHMEKGVIFHYEKTNRIVSLVIKDSDIEIELSQCLLNILGFEHRVYGIGTHQADRWCDVTEGFSALFIYSSVCRPQILGNTVAPLLRIIPVDSMSDNYNRTVSFRHVQYRPVVSTPTRHIEIDIRRDTGEPVSFQIGKFVATLHFKLLQ